MRPDSIPNPKAGGRASGSRALFLTTLCAMAACQGQCFTPPPETTLSVEFQGLADGQALTYVDDVAPGTLGFQHDVVVRSMDSQSRPATLQSAALQTRLSSEATFTPGPPAQLSGNIATFPAADLREGINVLQVMVTEAVSGRTASKSINVTVELGRPKVLTFRFQGDASADGALNQAEQATGEPAALLTVQGVEDGQTITVKDQGPAGTVYGTGTVTSGAASVTLGGLGVTDTTEATYQLVASVADRAGRDNVIANPTPSQPLNTEAFRILVVDRVVPELTLLSPSVPGSSQVLNMSDDADPGMDGFQVRVAVRTSADVAAGGVQVTHTPPGTVDSLAPDAVSHQASVDFTVPDSGPFDYTVLVAVADAAGNARSRTFTLQIGGGGSLGFVSSLAFSDNTLNGEPTGPFKRNVRRNVPFGGAQAIVAATNVGYWSSNTDPEIPNTVIVDQDLATAGAQLIVSAVVAGGIGCAPTLFYGGTAVATGAALATNTPSVTVLSATLASSTSGALRFMADCGGGRIFGPPATNLTVDVDPPSAVPSTLTLVNSGAFSERRPAVDAAWGAGNDDGATGQGVASGFELRWGSNATLRKAVSPLPVNLYDRRPGIDTDVRYFDTNRTQLPSGGTLPGSATSFRLTGLPAIEDYHVQVRARDDVGNLSPLVPTDCSTGSGCLSHQLRVLTLHNPGTAGFIGYLMEAADLNGDGASDLAFTSIGTRTAWVAYGGSTPFTTVSQVVIPVSPLALTNPYSIAVGNAGDEASGGSLPDLAVADPTWNGARGRYFLYFGRTGTIGPLPVELRGTAAGMSSGSGSGSSTDTGYIRILGDFGRPGGGPPDGLSEVAISANNDNGGIGRVYLFYGRPHDVLAGPGSWEALATATDAPDPTRYIPLSAADRIFDGESPPSGTGNAFFGVRLGYASLGDITGDGVPDFTIPSSMGTVSRLYVYSGALVNGSPTTTVAAATRLQRIDEATSAEAQWRGFGSFALGGLDLLGGAGKDLAVSIPRVNTVQIYRDGSASGYDTTAANVLKIVGQAGSFGRAMATADLDQDGQRDLVVGTNACVSLCTDGYAGGAWVFYNRRPFTPEFDLSTDDAAFRTTRLMKDFSVSENSDALGLGVATGDFNGDGIQDVAVSDPLIPSAPGRGKIYLRY